MEIGKPEVLQLYSRGFILCIIIDASLRAGNESEGPQDCNEVDPDEVVSSAFSLSKYSRIGRGEA